MAGNTLRFGNARNGALKKLGFRGFPLIRMVIREILRPLFAVSDNGALTSIAHRHPILTGCCHNRLVNYPTRRQAGMGLFLMLSGLGAWLASLTLAREGYQLALTGEKPSCDINPFFSCGNVMQSWQATLFFDTPNQLFGIGGYAVVAVIGAAMLSGSTFKRGFWVLTTLGLFFAYSWLMWMFYQAVFVIGFLCLYCMVVWAIHIIVWWLYLPWALKQGMLGSSPRLKKLGAQWLPYSWILMVINYAVIGLSIMIQFPLLFSL